MPDIRCPNCGKSNPDLLDVCQFCQTPLPTDSILRGSIGEPEPGLPDWLKNIQQQAQDAAEEDAAQAAAMPVPQKDEPPDLLAGLASQSGSADDEDVPDWLAGLSPAVKSAPQTPSASEPEPRADSSAQSHQKESSPEAVDENTPQDEALPWLRSAREEATIPFERDELSDWFNQVSGEKEEFTTPAGEQKDMAWGTNFDSRSGLEDQPAPKEEEDLGWLHNLEAAARQTGELQKPGQEPDWHAEDETPSRSSSASGEDLSWLDRLGGIEESSQTPSSQPTAAQDDLSWLNQFSSIPETPAPSRPAAPQEDLSWLNNFGAPIEDRPVDAAPNQPIPPQPFIADAEDLNRLDTPGGTAEPQPSFSTIEDKPSSEEDLSWLNDLGRPSPSQEPAAKEDLSWLNEMGGESELFAAPPFVHEQDVAPRHTAPLDKDVVDEQPDWLKSATQTPSMPAPGDLSLDWFSGTGQDQQEETPASAPSEADIFSAPGEPSSLSNQDVDSLFSVDLPDWLSRAEAGAADPASPQASAVPPEGDELTPVDLPSWVQAMRPVGAVITEATPRVEDQPAETEGPLAGFHGVIPIAPTGSSKRPKAVSLTLQTSQEQQSSALLLEQILGSETSPRTLVAAPVIASQQWLRWALSGLFLIVLSAMIFLRSQMLPVPAGLPEDIGGLSNAVMGIPANARILVVIDYEPALAAEMEAVGGPLLDQIALLSQPNLSFISTSPNGAALAERLMANTGINAQYLNLGYLPGGAAGVLGFIEAPGQIVPAAGVQFFSEYAALLVLTDHAESGRVWVEQLQQRKQVDLTVANQPLLMAASAQAGPLLQPYVSSRQITGLISGLPDATRYEALNNNRPGTARTYWDTFGAGVMMSVALMIVGSLWSLFTGMRARRAAAEQG